MQVQTPFIFGEVSRSLDRSVCLSACRIAWQRNSALARHWELAVRHACGWNMMALTQRLRVARHVLVQRHGDTDQLQPPARDLPAVHRCFLPATAAAVVPCAIPGDCRGAAPLCARLRQTRQFHGVAREAGLLLLMFCASTAKADRDRVTCRTMTSRRLRGSHL